MSTGPNITRSHKDILDNTIELVLHIHPLSEYFVGTGFASDSMLPYVVTAGNDAFGAAYTELIPPDSSPQVVGHTEYNPNEILVTAVSQTGLWRVRFAYGTSAGDALTNEGNGMYSEMLVVPSVVPADTTPFTIHMRDAVFATEGLYARAHAAGKNVPTISFFFQLHEQ